MFREDFVHVNSEALMAVSEFLFIFVEGFASDEEISPVRLRFESDGNF